MHIKKIITSVVFVLLCGINKSGKAQDFNYTLSFDSTYNYSPLVGATSLSSNSQWLFTYNIPTGFNDVSKKEVTLETNGFAIYNKSKNYALMAFNNFRCKLDSNSNYSQLSYLTEGEEGNKILKIEFKNVAQFSPSDESLTYQIWVKENGGFEIIIGPSTYNTSIVDTLIDTTQVVYIGLINKNMNSETNGFFIGGQPNIPIPVPLNNLNTELAFMRTIPKQGYRYIFNPVTN